MFTTGGVTLGWHIQQVETQIALKYRAWDWVILQQKTHPFDGVAALREDCRVLLPFIQEPTRVMLFMTWPEKRLPENGRILDDAFRRVTGEIGAALSPVSTAWRMLGESSPEIELYDEDGEHANPAGNYLAACVFYILLSGRSPQGLPGRICLAGDELVNLPEKSASRLQEAAWQAARSSSLT